MVVQGSLTRECFQLSPCWHEYQYPSQIDRLEELCVNRDWLLRELVENGSEKQVDAWYASTKDSPFELDTVSACLCELAISPIQTTTGYATIVEREVVSITLFEPDVVLSSADILDEENWMALRQLGIAPDSAGSGDVVVGYSLALTEFGASGVLSIPYARPVPT
jgi:hypothetical protein